MAMGRLRREVVVMFNLGNFRHFLATGDNACPKAPVVGLRPARAVAEDDEDELVLQEKKEPMAKTFLKKTLMEHDKIYHPNGYKEGDKCNFRAAMMKNDMVDAIINEKPKDEVRVGLVKFIEKDDGTREPIGIVDIQDVEGRGDETGKDK